MNYQNKDNKTEFNVKYITKIKGQISSRKWLYTLR